MILTFPLSSFAIQGIGTEPIIAVSGNSVNINNNDNTPQTNDFTDFGNLRVTGESTTRTFVIQNNGTATLNISGAVNITGTNAADFTITTPPASAIAPSASTSFQVTFNPSDSGSRSATIQITSDDTDLSPFSFAIQGTGTEPIIAVSGNSVTINNNDITPQTADFTNFGQARTDGETINRTFVIQNNGTATLNIFGAVNITGTNAADFTITTPLASAIAPSASTSFQVTFNPSGAGVRNATIQITSDDTDLSPFSFAIQGTGTEPIIAVSGNSVNINNNDNTPQTADFTDFGQARTDGETITRSFTIQNNGTATLSLTGASLVQLSDSTFFRVDNSSTAALLSSGASTTFDITFDPTNTGLAKTTVIIPSDDSNIPTFRFDLQGNGIIPNVVIISNNNEVPNGSLIPETSNNTNFGSVYAAFDTVIRTFFIKNLGNATLNLTSPTITINGVHANEFTLDTSTLLTSISPGDSTSFSVSFVPRSPGTKNANLIINTDDPLNLLYGFNIEGNGLEQLPIAANDTFYVVKNIATLLEVQINDVHPGNHELFTQIIRAPSRGFTNIIDKDIIYQPTIEFTGLDTIVYQICDFNNLCDEATIYIEVIENNKPIAEDDFVNVITNSSIEIDVQGKRPRIN